MDKIWLSRYPAGVPPEITVEHASIAAVFEDTRRRFAERPAYANLGTTLSYAECDALSRSLAAWFQSQGLPRGSRVALMLPNILQYPVVMLAVLRAGLVVVNVNPMYTPRELAHQLEDSGATTIVILANFAATLQQVLAETPVERVIITELGDLLRWPKRLLLNIAVKYVRRAVPRHDMRVLRLRRLLAAGRRLALDPPELGHEDIAFLQYTGGTTGVAKGAILTHGNLLANMAQISAWYRPVTVDGQEIMITALPLYHVYSLTSSCLSFIPHGSLNVLITDPRNLRAFVRELRRWPFTMMVGVNTLYNALLSAPGFEDLDFSSLKVVSGGGMAIQRAVAERWLAVTGRPITQGYGLTEASPVVTINPIDVEDFTGSIGLPVPSTDVRICDESGAQLGVDQAGELWVKGPQVMRGYWQKPRETRRTLTEDGWLATGDLARVDAEGFVYLVDRLKDMIIVSGFKIFPNEIEDVLTLMPEITEAAVIGVAHERSGEAIKAFVTVRGERRIGREEILAHCREHLTAYKVPKYIEFRDELPKSNVGKILRRDLRE